MSENSSPPEPPRPPGGSDTPPPPPPPPPSQPPPPGQGWGPPPGDGGAGYPPPPGGGGGYGPPPGDGGGYGGYGGPPPPPPGPGGARPYAVGDAFSYAWEKFKANWGPLVLIALVLVLASGATQFLGNAIVNGVAGPTVNAQGQVENGGFFGAAMILGFLFGAITFVVNLIIQAGIIKGSLALTRNQPITFGTAFNGINWGQVIAAALINGVLLFIGLLLCVIPGIIVAFLTSYTLFFVVDRDMSAVDAIKASVSMVRSNVGPLILFFLASLAATIVGACLCGVGLLAAYPIVALAQAYTFRTINNDPVQA